MKRERESEHEGEGVGPGKEAESEMEAETEILRKGCLETLGDKSPPGCHHSPLLFPPQLSLLSGQAKASETETEIERDGDTDRVNERETAARVRLVLGKGFLPSLLPPSSSPQRLSLHHLPGSLCSPSKSARSTRLHLVSRTGSSWSS